MKTIILFRHGKSDWNDGHQTDHERTLAPRGIKAARRMGKWLASGLGTPEHLVSSTAVRALSTMTLARESGAWPADIHTTNRLYEARAEDYLAVIRETPDEAASVLVTGHEPTCSSTTGRLVGNASIRFPTAAMARIDVAVESWRDIQFGMGTLVWFMAPKFLSGDE